MANKSAVVQRLDFIQKELVKLLKPLGFRRKGRTLSRLVDTDMLQLIALQAGPFEIGAPLPPEAAYLRPNFYGKFTVNLGVFVPEIFERTNLGYSPRGVISDAHCSIRTRLSHITSHEDYWWSLDEEPEVLIDEIGSLLIGVGIPFLERFGSRNLIIRDWMDFNEQELCLSGVPRLDVAMIHWKKGDTGAAKILFETHYAEYLKDPRNLGHGPYVKKLALKLGLGEIG